MKRWTFAVLILFALGCLAVGCQTQTLSIEQAIKAAQTQKTGVSTVSP